MRAKKTFCPECGRAIKAGKHCPLAPHIKLMSGKILRPIRMAQQGVGAR